MPQKPSKNKHNRNDYRQQNRQLRRVESKNAAYAQQKYQSPSPQNTINDLRSNFSLSNSWQTTLLLSILVMSASIDFADAISTQSNLKYNNKGSIDEKAFIKQLKSSFQKSVSKKNRNLVVSAANEMSLKDKKMFSLCLATADQLDSVQDRGLINIKQLNKNKGGLALEANLNSQTASAQLLLSKKASKQLLSITIPHESYHCVQSLASNKFNGHAVSKIKKECAIDKSCVKTKINNFFEELPDQQGLSKCIKEYESFKQKLNLKLTKANAGFDTLSQKDADYFVDLGLAFLNNYNKIRKIISFTKAQKEIFENVRDDPNQQKIGLQAVGATFSSYYVGSFLEGVVDSDSYPRKVICAEAIANLSELPKAVLASLDKDLSKMITQTKQTVFNDAMSKSKPSTIDTMSQIFPSLKTKEETKASPPKEQKPSTSTKAKQAKTSQSKTNSKLEL